jgi:hypothetical protein
MYIAIHGMGTAKKPEDAEIKKLLVDSGKDIFDMVSTFLLACFFPSCTYIFMAQMTVQDHIDGGITLLMRCPGYHASEELTAENITVDIYISPHELLEGGTKMNENVAVMVQKFWQDFALPHLHRFAAHCHVENIVPPQVPCESYHYSNIILYLQSTTAFGNQLKA